MNRARRAAEGVPEGYKLLDYADVVVGNGEIVINGNPEDHIPGGHDAHDCDQMGCSSLFHVIYRASASEGPSDLERERDELWCRALTQTLAPVEIERVTRRFNELRPAPDAPKGADNE